MRFLAVTALLLGAPVALVAAPAQAGPIRAYTPAALAQARTAGLPVLVDVHADWCPTCRAQDPTIFEIARDPAFARLVILKLDFDSQAPERRALGVGKQSTLIVYRGSQELGRTTGVTDRSQIRALAAAALR